MPVTSFPLLPESHPPVFPDNAELRRAILYSGLAVGVLVGIAVSTYFWRQHAKAALEAPPSQRAEDLMASCESKLDEIERALAQLQAARKE